jgi:hypothetical protein
MNTEEENQRMDDFVTELAIVKKTDGPQRSVDQVRKDLLSSELGNLTLAFPRTDEVDIRVTEVTRDLALIEARLSSRGL